MASRTLIELTASIVNVNGMISAIAMAPVSPGMAPTTTPIVTPATINASVTGSRQVWNPLRRFSHIPGTRNNQVQNNIPSGNWTLINQSNTT